MNRYGSVMILIVLLVLFFSSVGSGAGEENLFILRLKSEAEIETPYFYLSDLVKKFSFEDSDILISEKIEEDLKEVKLGQSPREGYTRRVDTSLVMLRLNQLRLEERYDLSLEVDIPESIHIRRVSEIISPESISSIAVEYIEKQMLENDLQTRIDLINSPKEITVPGGMIDLIVDPEWADRFSRSLSTGFVSVPVLIMLDGERLNRVHIQLRIRQYEEVITAVSDIPSNAPITADDVIIEYKDVSSLNYEPFTDPGEIVNYQLERAVSKGSIITDNMLETPDLISRGDEVIVIVEDSGLKIQTTGEARENGADGELIKVRNSSSGKMIEAVVIGPQKVKVLF